ncbi:unnamed protein product [Rangifer tarandus platyrhynchus]|uniref:Uncharacterized protein n=2 Tax=Rangifer tarandus platyrhynchus TaxID=3082113 RepID=A0AC59ZBQ2_RANTA|nr:unnamed protein product [Rangifer tarandus platyrhynchus]
MPPVRTRSAFLAFLPPALTPTCAPPQDPVLSQPPVTLIVPWSSPPPQPLSLLQARYHTRRQSTLAATETQPSQAPGIPRDKPSSGERPEQTMVSGQTCPEC